MTVRSFHAASTYFRKFASAFGAGSVATTFNPRARYSAAQLAPITPVPTIATFRISLFFPIQSSLECFAFNENLACRFRLLPTRDRGFDGGLGRGLRNVWTMVLHD